VSIVEKNHFTFLCGTNWYWLWNTYEHCVGNCGVY